MAVLTGRQVARLIFDHLILNSTEGAILENEDLLAIELKGDNLVAFRNDWDIVMEGLRKTPPEDWLEYLFRRQLDRSEQLSTIMSLYNQETYINGAEKSYDKLYSLLCALLEQKQRKKNRENMSSSSSGRAHPGKAKQRSASPGGKRRQGDCNQWVNQGKCSRGDDCSFKHDDDKKGKRKGSQARGRSTSRDSPRGDRRRSPSGKSKGKGDRVRSPARGPPTRGTSPSGKANKDPCKWHIKGTCKHGDKCDLWHIPLCKFFKVSKCTRNECIFLHPDGGANAAEKQPKTVKDEKPKAKAEPKPKKQKGKDSGGCAFGKASIVMATAMMLIAPTKSECVHQKFGVSFNEAGGDSTLAVGNSQPKHVNSTTPNSNLYDFSGTPRDVRRSTGFVSLSGDCESAECRCGNQEVRGHCRLCHRPACVYHWITAYQLCTYCMYGPRPKPKPQPKRPDEKKRLHFAFPSSEGQPSSSPKVSKGVRFTKEVLKQAKYREEHPLVLQGKSKRRHSRDPIEDDPAYIEGVEKACRFKAWELHKEVYGNASMSKFFVIGKEKKAEPKWKAKSTAKDTAGGNSPRVLHELPAASTVARRRFLVDSGASYHLISRRMLTKKERKSIRKASPVELTTANGTVKSELVAEVYVHDLGATVTAYLLADVPPILSLGKLCSESGFDYKWLNGQDPFLQKGKHRIICHPSQNVPWIVPATSLTHRRKQ